MEDSLWKNTQIKTVPKAKMSRTKRCTCTCGKFTLTWSAVALLGREPRRKTTARPTYANACTFHLITQTYRGLASSVLEPACPACRSWLYTFLSPMFHDIMLVLWIRPWWKQLHHGNWQTSYKSGLWVWRGDLSAHHYLGLPLRLCQW